MLGLYRKPLASKRARSGLPTLYVCTIRGEDGTSDSSRIASPFFPLHRHHWLWCERPIATDHGDMLLVPKSTSLMCWWDMCGFEWTPFPLPLRHDERRETFVGIGNFCSPACASAYARESRHMVSSLPRILSLIDLLARRYYGHVGTVRPAPPREALAALCGSSGMSIETFRSLSQRGRARMLPPFMISELQVMVAEDTSADVVTGCGKAPRHKETRGGVRIDGGAVLTSQQRNVFAGTRARRLDELMSCS